jgi:hypothetical protein
LVEDIAQPGARRERQQAHALFNPVKDLPQCLDWLHREQAAYIAFLMMASTATVTLIFSALSTTPPTWAWERDSIE